MYVKIGTQHFDNEGVIAISAITFQNVSYIIDERELLRDMTGTIEKGRITTLVGPSGAGKTTLLKLCNGLYSATTGTVSIAQRPISSIEPTELRRYVGIALQAAPMIDGTVYDNLCLPKQLRGETLTKEQAYHFLDDVHLPHNLLMQQARDLSGGQRQRVSIARTLVNRSPILLLDEITSALDRTACREIEALIQHINDTYDTTIVWITHNLQQALSIGHDTWIMMDGRLIEAGPSSLLTESTNEAVQAFVRGDAQ
ncbi:phosphate ABC transporter ATP-binding protein [Caryophanon latum]|uniref:Phosphate ABC transporter ATP-binding protein n=1 Tax=Caryophanon latum TaxID=33977 RepID=A0A1C0YPC9_9BACL|nr:phosphate ABC transporter ATP-binding protein [Caryophanon latum]OCS88929.1 phosphate ABC transporter ATP-binding protein [Caryophanon latum]